MKQDESKSGNAPVLRKRTEDESRESEEKFRLLFENAPLGITHYNSEGVITECNEQLAKMLGTSKEKVIGIIMQAAFKDMKQKIALEEALRGGTGQFEGVYTAVTGNKSSFLRTIYAPIFATDGSVAGGMSITEDFTERKKTEEELAEYVRAIDSSKDLMAAVDSQYNYIFVNKIFLIYYGLSRDQVVGHPVSEVIGKEFFEIKIKPNLDRCLQGEIVRFEIASRYPTLGARNLEVTYYPLKGTVKKITGVVAVINDITERKRVEDELRENEVRFRIFSDFAFEGIVIHNKRKIIDVNYSFAKMFGYERDELIGTYVLKLIAPESLDQVRIILLKEYEQSYEAVGLRKDGSTFMMEINAKSIEMNGRLLRVVAIRDISAYKQAVEEVRKSHDELHKLTAYIQEMREEERKRIAHEIHDDLGQILTALKIDISLLKEDITRKDSSLLQKVESMSDLVNNCLSTVKKISSEIRPDILDHLGLKEAIRWYVSEFGKRSRIKCRLLLYHEELNLNQRFSENLFRLVQESLTNVVRHAKATEVIVGLRKKKDVLELRIKDNGTGVKQKDITASESFGLIGMRERARYCGGSFEIEGFPNKGTTITVTIPMAEGK